MILFSKKVTGTLRKVGVSRPKGKNHSKYSFIQIDDIFIKDVRIRDSIGSYLDIGDEIEIVVTRLPMTLQMKAILYLKNKEFTVKENIMFLLMSALAFGFVWLIALGLIEAIVPIFGFQSPSDILWFVVFIATFDFIRSVISLKI